MPHLTPSKLGVVSLVLATFAVGAACSDGGDTNATAGGAPWSSDGGLPTDEAAGGAGNTSSQSCIPANPNGTADHMRPGYDTEPCSACHGSALRGGVVYDPSGAVAVAQATVTITSTDGTSLTAVTGSTGMFCFWDTISAPYQVCVSKCPDTVCSTATDHPNAGDCGTCHGVTTTTIHLP